MVKAMINNVNKAIIEYHRTKTLSAFNLRFNPIRRKLNQFCTLYIFEDNSKLKIYNYSNKMLAIAPNGKAQEERILFN